MKTFAVLLYLLCALGASSLARAEMPLPLTIVRGQTPTFQSEDPILGVPEPFGSGPTTAPEVYPNGGAVSPFTLPSQQPPLTYDPFLVDPAQTTPYGGGLPGSTTFGTAGPQPFRYGWQSRYDVTYLPREDVKQGFGGLEIFEFNSEWEYTTPTRTGWIFSVTPEFGLRTWEGPSPPPARPVHLPGSAFHFATDLELQTPANGPFSVQLGFTPQINSDLERHLTSDA